MARMSTRIENRRRSLFATLCLLAVVLLHAPLGAAGWTLYSSACCNTTGQCPIHGHHHQAPSRASSENPMECDHQMPGMSMCKMSCCDHADRAAIAPVLFVLPPVVVVFAPSDANTLITSSSTRNELRSIEPLSPPPRFSAMAA